MFPFTVSNLQLSSRGRTSTLLAVKVGMWQQDTGYRQDSGTVINWPGRKRCLVPIMFCCCTEKALFSAKARNSNRKNLPSGCVLLLYFMLLFTSAPRLQGSATSTYTTVASALLLHTHPSLAWALARSARVSIFKPVSTFLAKFP